MRRCDVKSCASIRADAPMGTSGYTSFMLEGRDYDVCPTCRKTLKGWMEGTVTMFLPKENNDQRKVTS